MDFKGLLECSIEHEERIDKLQDNINKIDIRYAILKTYKDKESERLISYFDNLLNQIEELEKVLKLYKGIIESSEFQFIGQIPAMKEDIKRITQERDEYKRILNASMGF